MADLGSSPDAPLDLEFGGTATTLLRLGPFRFLTDPNFLHRGQRAYLGKGLWSRRLTDPALLPEALPALDAVLLSHLHGDHFDREARRRLDRTVPILTTPQAASRLRRWDFAAARGLDTWDDVVLERDGWRARVVATPGRHGPGLVDRLLPPVMGEVVELSSPTGTSHRLYVTGDTLFRPALRAVVDRTGPLDAMVVHLGGTRVAGVLVTMDDAQGADLVELLDPDLVVPVHHDDYGVFRSPLADFLTTCEHRGLRHLVRPVARGERVSLLP